MGIVGVDDPPLLGGRDHAGDDIEEHIGEEAAHAGPEGALPGGLLPVKAAQNGPVPGGGQSAQREVDHELGQIRGLQGQKGGQSRKDQDGDGGEGLLLFLGHVGLHAVDEEVLGKEGGCAHAVTGQGGLDGRENAAEDDASHRGGQQVGGHIEGGQ